MRELARFLFQKGDFSLANNVVRPGAFLPQLGQTSVFVIERLDADAILSIGEEVARSRGKPSKARAEFDVADVTAVGLRFERDDVPFRHGNLLGWPADGPEIKARQKAIAVELSARSDLVVH